MRKWLVFTDRATFDTWHAAANTTKGLVAPYALTLAFDNRNVGDNRVVARVDDADVDVLTAPQLAALIDYDTAYADGFFGDDTG